MYPVDADVILLCAAFQIKSCIPFSVTFSYNLDTVCSKQQINSGPRQPLEAAQWQGAAEEQILFPLICLRRAVNAKTLAQVVVSERGGVSSFPSPTSCAEAWSDISSNGTRAVLVQLARLEARAPAPHLRSSHVPTAAMTSFICSPLSVTSSKSIGRIPGYASGMGARTCSRFASCRMPVSCRMRNRGGFCLPPRVPQNFAERRRAMELLGNLTQRKTMRPSARREIEALVGAVPKTRAIAQQWKVALQYTPNARLKHLSQPSVFKKRREIMGKIRLPEQSENVGRCFVLLGVLERRYRSSQSPSTRVLQELEEKIGDYPVDIDETHHFIKALVVLQKERRFQELRPPRIPLESTEELDFTNMLLGAFSVRGSVGRQSGRLEELIGALPRNRNVAASWKKIIAAAIRKKKRREVTARRLAEIERKRHERRLRRQQRELEQRLTLPLPEAVSTDLAINDDQEKSTSTSCATGRSTPASDQETQGPASFVSRMQSVLGKIFGGRP